MGWFFQRLADVLIEQGQSVVHVRRRFAQGAAGHFEPQLRGEEELLQVVVEEVREPAAFPVLGLRQLGGERAELPRAALERIVGPLKLRSAMLQ